MRVTLKTQGRVDLKYGTRVRIRGLVYVVIRSDPPIELDDITCVTDCEVQPADARGERVVEAELVHKE